MAVPSNDPLRLSQQIQALSKIDLEQSWLLPDESGLVRAVSKSDWSGHLVELFGMRSPDSLFESSVQRIADAVEKNPDILQDPKTREAFSHLEKSLSARAETLGISCDCLRQLNVERVSAIAQEKLYAKFPETETEPAFSMSPRLEKWYEKFRSVSSDEEADAVDKEFQSTAWTREESLALLTRMDDDSYLVDSEGTVQILTALWKNANNDDSLLEEAIKLLMKEVPGIINIGLMPAALSAKNIPVLRMAIKVGGDESLMALINTIEKTIDTRDENDFLLEVGRALGKEALFERITREHIQPLSMLFTRAEDPQSKELSALLALGYPVDSDLLVHSVFSQNYAAINHVLAHASDTILSRWKHRILDALMITEDPHVAELFIRRYPELAKECSDSLLISAIHHGRSWFVDWVLSNGYSLSQAHAIDLLPLAVNSGSLPMIKRIIERAGLTATYPAILGLDQIKDHELRVKQLMTFAMFSPIEDVYALVAASPEYAPALNETLGLLSLFVRFPNLDFPTEMFTNRDRQERGPVTQPQEYLSKSLMYAKENRETVKKLLPEMNNLSRDELLSSIMQDRLNRLPSWNRDRDKYIIKQKDNPVYAVTPWRWAGSDEPNRYSWSLRHLIPLCYDPEKASWHPPNYDSVKQSEDHALRYSYRFKDEAGNDHAIETNTISKNWAAIVHPSGWNIQNIDLQKRLESLHKEIISYNLDLTNPKNSENFFKKVAEEYWLIASLCETWRGTPHNAMIWLNLIYEHHHLPAPIPKLDHFFLDNTMIVTPLERAIEDFSSYLEPTLDQALKATQGKEADAALIKLLEHDGMLLKQCSPAVRSDPRLVQIAVAQNPNAKDYALPITGKEKGG